MGTRISQLPPKDGNLADTDLLMISEATSDAYESKSITGAEIIASAQEGLQPTLVSGTNIKTVNSTSLLGSGNVAVQPTLESGTNIKTINGNSLLGSGDLVVGGGLTIGTTAITSGTVGRILFEGTGNVVQESANLFWDNTNARLGVGTASPNMALDIRTGNVGIGVTSDAGYKLDVNGTARVQGALTFSGGTFSANTITQGATYGLLVHGGTGSNSDLTLTDRGGNLRFRIVNGGNILQTKTTIDNIIIGGSSFSSKSMYVSGVYGLVFGGSAGSSFNFSLLESAGTNGLFIDSAGRAKVGAYNSVYNNSAILEAVSTTQGFLPPRMTNAQMIAIATPASGLMVYDTTNNKMCVYDGTAWQNLY